MAVSLSIPDVAPSGLGLLPLRSNDGAVSLAPIMIGYLPPLY